MIDMIPITRPELGEREAEAAAEVVRSGWLMTGPKTEAFEAAFSNRVQAPFGCAVSSCTAGLQLALQALGVQRGDAVITVSHSFIATANAVRLVGAEPVFIDIEPDTYNMSPVALSKTLETAFEKRRGSYWLKTPAALAKGESPWIGCASPVGKLAAILVPHQVGLPANMCAILSVAKSAGVAVLEDAACAIGAKISLNDGKTWTPIGAPLGAAACFSFHPRKIITTGEGGMVTTSNAELDMMIRILRQHGMDRSTLERENSNAISRERYLHTTTNYRMTDIQAAIGLIQLNRLDKIIARRRALAVRYGEAIKTMKDVIAPFEPPYARTTFQSYVVRLLGDAGRVKRIAESLRDNGVDSRPGIMCAHREPPYAQAWPEGCLPESESAMDETLIIPLFPAMTNLEQDRVLAALEDAAKL
jgi:dTDP-4-amino-4,6-dideoxygalactose transaminase